MMLGSKPSASSTSSGLACNRTSRLAGDTDIAIAALQVVIWNFRSEALDSVYCGLRAEKPHPIASTFTQLCQFLCIILYRSFYV